MHAGCVHGSYYRNGLAPELFDVDGYLRFLDDGGKLRLQFGPEDLGRCAGRAYPANKRQVDVAVQVDPNRLVRQLRRLKDADGDKVIRSKHIAGRYAFGGIRFCDIECTDDRRRYESG